MDPFFLFGPVLAHVALVALLYLELGRRRAKAAKARLIEMDDYLIVRGDEPYFCAQVARSIVNQFELPVLFYALALSIVVTDTLSTLQLVLLSIFVVARYFQALVHITSNKVSVRGAFFIAGFCALMTSWIIFAITVLGKV